MTREDERLCWYCFRIVAATEGHALPDDDWICNDCDPRTTMLLDEARIAAMNQRIFDRLFGSDDEDAPPVTRH